MKFAVYKVKSDMNKVKFCAAKVRFAVHYIKLMPMMGFVTRCKPAY